MSALRTYMLLALGLALIVLLILMLTAPIRTAVELDVPTGTTWHSGEGDTVRITEEP